MNCSMAFAFYILYYQFKERPNMTDPKFMTPPHRRADLTHLNRCKAMDSYHRALIYILTAVPALLE